MQSITDELVQKYKNFYQGGTYYYSDPKKITKKPNGGDRWETKRAFGNFEVDLEKYLFGTIDKGIVLSPLIKPENKCLFGAIDVDGEVYKNLEAKQKILKIIRSWSIVPCLSKSGGLHLYLFLKHAEPAKDLITVLRYFRNILGLPKQTEIFPKQDGTTVEMGNGIMLPFMKGQKNTFIKINEDGSYNEGSLQEFIDAIEKKIVNPNYFQDLLIREDESKDEEDEDRKYSIDEIKEKIGKEPLKGSLYDNWMTMLVAKLIAAKNTDDEIIESCLEHCTESKEENLKWITDKINRARNKWDNPNPDEAREQFLKNIIYVRKLDQYYNRKLNDVYKKEAINVEFSHLTPKRVKAATYLADHPRRIIVENFQYRPELYKTNNFIFEVSGKNYINTYKPNLIEPIKGNLELWEELLDHLFPALDIRTHMEDFISAHVQYAGKKIRHAPLIFSPAHRIGKGRLFAAIRKMLGEDNTAEIDIKRALNQSKDYLTNKQIVLIDELKSENNWSEAQTLLNLLKRNITEEWHGSRFLYQDFKDVYSCTNFMLFSNYTNALSIGKNEERYWVVRCDNPPKAQIFYKHFSAWLETPAAAQSLLYHYKNREMSDSFDFDGHAPLTVWSGEMSSEGSHPFKQRVAEDFKTNLIPFTEDLISILDVRIHYQGKYGMIRQNEISNALREIGGVDLGQAKVELPSRNTPWNPTLYVIRNHDKYKSLSLSELGKLYKPLFHPDTEQSL